MPDQADLVRPRESAQMKSAHKIARRADEYLDFVCEGFYEPILDR
jgi:hypothetical protein